MDKILFIINPIAGGGRARRLVPIIDNFMKNVELDYDIVLTEQPRDGINIAKKGLKKGYKKIVAVGGDGTVNEVALGILEHGEGTLGIIPSGTGNDLARTLNIPFNIEESIGIIIKGINKKVDVGMVNGDLFLNIASIGFDSVVVKNTEKIKKRLKSGIAYFIGVIITLVGFKDINTKLEIDNILIDKDIFLVAVGNGKYYGGGLKVLPMALIEDGYFHICIVNKMSKLKLLLLLPTIIKGKHIKFKKHVEIFKAKKVRIFTKDRTYLNIDGEVKDIEKEILFTIKDEKLSIFVNN
ncbi:Diacylglycerol kinase catalytic region [[Clostridium] ultunense Esp]|uniref:Diacylglycerol kinase catalytic region n=1 Tax=[Clostridium] ultunense Esp TaxID=1288971 RepID=M1Z259_9FIRM|nr:diacylglycerol kinase family protein [Schnuerera ultunensis]CCQ96950.1 Diacylglycerol kinase catalytic region [[Clostridium] ultunense Esp]SHD78060.1 Diacylglycerol kinase catalytic region [[Clostridium] ultunense Esp]